VKEKEMGEGGFCLGWKDWLARETGEEEEGGWGSPLNMSQ